MAARGIHCIGVYRWDKSIQHFPLSQTVPVSCMKGFGDTRVHALADVAQSFDKLQFLRPIFRHCHRYNILYGKDNTDETLEDGLVPLLTRVDGL